MQALPAVPRRFWDIAMVVVSHTPPNATVEDAQVARALNMRLDMQETARLALGLKHMLMHHLGGCLG